eukprot:1707423-Ditylum_brightwellii.AAC.1
MAPSLLQRQQCNNTKSTIYHHQYNFRIVRSITTLVVLLCTSIDHAAAFTTTSSSLLLPKIQNRNQVHDFQFRSGSNTMTPTSLLHINRHTVGTKRNHAPSSLFSSPSGIDEWPVIAQAFVFLGTYVGLGIGTAGSAEFHVAWTGAVELLGGCGLLLGAVRSILELDEKEEKKEIDAQQQQQEDSFVDFLIKWITPTSSMILFTLTLAVTPDNIYMYTHGATMGTDGLPLD